LSKEKKIKICLGIESTAHTFSVGILDFDGNILSICNDMYIPKKGGLHPREVVEHHVSVFMKVIKKALYDAKIALSDIDLIAFSQGPGLGMCLRIGAGIARSLAQSLNIPIVGVNHCVAHVEIGRRACGAMDPITLYVSGGNTLVSAFEAGKYRIFGETLDISLGNLLDMVARKLGYPHPGGPKMEKMAKLGTKYLQLPYIVKGMDLSFAGIFTKCMEYIKSKDFEVKYNENDIAYSLQETAFAMLAEVTERAVAHTEKKEVLLTGGVAANKRLQSMIRSIAEEHGAEFFTVPLNLAGDNGAMIGWTGILYYLNKGGQQIRETKIEPKWRMDEVDIPWRQFNANFSAEKLIQGVKTKGVVEGKVKDEAKGCVENGRYMDKADLDNVNIIKKGAEATLVKSILEQFPVVIKYRNNKKYRIKNLDDSIRFQRTIQEARILYRLKKWGIPVPMVYYIDEDNASFTMDYIEGTRLKDILDKFEVNKIKQLFKEVGRYMGILHQNDEIHGDLTTSNIIFTKNSDIFFIDFGLGYKSSSIEDKTVDLHLFKRVITSSHEKLYDVIFPAFIEGYKNSYTNENKDIAEEIVKRIKKIELRGRYIKKEKRKA